MTTEPYPPYENAPVMPNDPGRPTDTEDAPPDTVVVENNTAFNNGVVGVTLDPEPVPDGVA